MNWINPDLQQRRIEDEHWKACYMIASEHLKVMTGVLEDFRKNHSFTTESATKFLHECVDTVYEYVDIEALEQESAHLGELIQKKSTR